MSKYKYGIIIPTVAIPSAFITFFDYFLETLQDDTIVVLSVNSLNAQEGKRTIKVANLCFEKLLMMKDFKNVSLQILESEKPVGWCVANNAGYEFLKKEGLPEFVTFMNDDVRLNKRWQENLKNAVTSTILHHESALSGTLTQSFPSSKLGTRIGVATPSCNKAIGTSNIIRLLGEEGSKFQRMSFELQSNFAKETYDHIFPIPTQLISGVLYFFKRECLEDLEYEENKVFDEYLNNGGFDDNDLCARMTNKGWSAVVDFKTYMQHDASKTCKLKEFSYIELGTKNFCKFLKKHEEDTQSDKIVTALYRVKIKSIQDYLYLRSSLYRSGQIVDKISFLSTNNFVDIMNSIDFVKNQFKLSEEERNFFSSLNEENYSDKIINMISKISSIEKENIYFESWSGTFNERDERNRCIENARKLGTDYMFSIDSDEVIEERFTKELLQKIIKHPNPNILGYLITWRNHWESPSIVNSTFPIGDDGRLTGGMLGIRLWKDIGQNIVTGNEIGLHCGNAPPLSESNVLHINLSMRHFSLLRKEDREEKFYNYSKIDPQPDSSMGYGNYNHIVKSDIVKVSEYNSRTGIICNMLFYEKENPYNLFQWLSNLHTVMDDINITWTGKWNKEDKVWKDFIDVQEWPSKENWYKTGPDYETAHLLRLFNVEVVHLEKTDEVGFSSLRNYGLDILRERKSKYTRWATFFDPDEVIVSKIVEFQRALTSCSHRNKEFGFLFKFSNYNSQGKAAYSESIRMFNIDKDIVRFSGKVHESLVESIDILLNNGVGIQCTYFPIILANTGLMISAEEATEKFKKYAKLSLQQIKDNPLDTTAWHTLGMQYHEAKNFNKCLVALERSVLCSGVKYLAFESLGQLHLRMAKGLIKNALARVDRGHSKFDYLMKMVSFLDEYAPALLNVNHNLHDFNPELPDFPYDTIDDMDKWKGLITHVGSDS